jgi:hypothetical protein
MPAPVNALADRIAAATVAASGKPPLSCPPWPKFPLSPRPLTPENEPTCA